MIRWPKVDTKYIKLSGGIDLESPALSIDPGAARSLMNYVVGAMSGYDRIDGYERYSGKTSPSDGVYYYATATFSGSVAVGDTITGATSTATGKVIIVDSTEIYFTKLAVSTFVVEDFKVGGVTVGAFTMTPTRFGASTAYEDAVARNATADDYRADIAVPTGSGGILGLGMLKGILYCFRNNAGDTAADMFKATASGWEQVTLYNEISFTAGGTATALDTDTLTQGGVTATVKRVALQSGAWSGTAVGRLIIANPSGGNFTAGAATCTGSGATVTLSGVQTAITLVKGGRYECIEHNFTGSADTMKMYGVDGTNRGFEFDGTVFVPIATGMTTDTPNHVCAHKNHLVYSFRGSMQFSGIGFPYQWTLLTGAAEIGMGDTISGFLPQPGDILAVFTRNRTDQLAGTSTANFALGKLAPEVGAIPYTLQNLGSSYALDDRGITKIRTAQEYGNFEHATVSRQVQRLIADMRSVVVASATYKTRNQYRLYGSDGTGISMTIVSTRDGLIEEYSQFKYPVNITCAYSGEDANGKDVIFLGDSTGYVYQADKGSSFDGTAIEGFVRLPFYHFKSPAYEKSFLKAILEMETSGYSEIRIHPDFSYGKSEISQHPTTTLDSQGSGGYWDVDHWEGFYYDSQVVANPEISINGDGTNMSLVTYTNSDIDLGHTLQGAIIYYIVRHLVT